MDRLFPTVLAALLRGEDLPAALAEQVMDEIVSDAATPAQIAAFAGLVASLMRHVTPVPIDGCAVDVVAPAATAPTP
jgi:anthranilate phosphoribosyltransferase